MPVDGDVSPAALPLDFNNICSLFPTGSLAIIRINILSRFTR